MPDGSLDYEDDLLAELDWVIASVHTSFRMKEENMTKRMIAAIEHPLVRAIGHPTGRLIGAPRAIPGGHREGRGGCGPHRHLPRDQRQPGPARPLRPARAPGRGRGREDRDRLRRARRERLANLRYGVATARRAWLTKADIANTRTWKQLQKLMK